MKSLHSPQIIVIGNFDGVHRGHQMLLREGVLLSKSLVPTCLLTFRPHPHSFFSGKPELLLCSREESRQQMKAWGIDSIIEQTFDAAFSRLSPIEFLEDFLHKKLQAAGIVVGFDFRFGRERAGDLAFLKNWAASKNIPAKVVAPVLWQGEKISTGRVKRLILEGRMLEVPDLLGRPFRLHGMVQPGHRRGNQIGFPTANIVSNGLVNPPPGVYLTRTCLQEKFYLSVTHIGGAPTVERVESLIETHILDQSFPDLYGKEIHVEFYSQLRSVQKFESLDALKAQIAKDISAGKQLASKKWELSFERPSQ